MSTLDGLGNTLGGLLGRLGSSEIAGTIARSLGPAVMQSVLAQLNANGLGAKVNSWLGKGPNEPITADEIRAGLGNEKVQEIARSLGIPADQLADVLAQHLPAAAQAAAQGGSPPPAA